MTFSPSGAYNSNVKRNVFAHITSLIALKRRRPVSIQSERCKTLSTVFNLRVISCRSSEAAVLPVPQTPLQSHHMTAPLTDPGLAYISSAVPPASCTAQGAYSFRKCRGHEECCQLKRSRVSSTLVFVDLLCGHRKG